VDGCETKRRAIGGDRRIGVAGRGSDAEFLVEFAEQAGAVRFAVAFVSADEAEGVPVVVPLGEVARRAVEAGAADDGEGRDGVTH
jgi:hypothetical protein